MSRLQQLHLPQQAHHPVHRLRACPLDEGCLEPMRLGVVQLFRTTRQCAGTVLSNPAAASASKCSASLVANLLQEINAPTSMFRSWAASVKFADVTNALRR